ncbi:MAG: ABC transporter permease [Oscillospiraceae bacterium]|nr:ABC transporter permease [Oscillospiraceae bacterium]
MGKARKLLRSKTSSLVILLLLIIAFFWIFSRNHSYLKLNNIRNILNSMVIYTLLAVGGGLLIIFGEIDLSPGYIGTAAGAMMAALLSEGGAPWFAVLICCLLFGAAFGAINAALVNELGFQSFIATLATGSFIAAGLAYIMVDGETIEIKDSVIVWIGTGKIGDVLPVTIIISLTAILIYGTVLAKTKFGRSVYLCGENRVAAHLAGLSPKKLSYILFANSGMLGALAGVLYDARLRAGNLTGTNHYAFPSITAAILGGVALGGGTGNMFGCFLGLLIVSSFNNGLSVMGVSPYWQSVASGLLLLAALVLDYITSRERRPQKLTGGAAVGKNA